MPEAPPDDTTPPPDATCGRMIVTLRLNASNRPVPTVEFDPPGLFTAGFIYNHLTYFTTEAERAQAKVRHENARLAREGATA